jgi:hypothetical protein
MINYNMACLENKTKITVVRILFFVFHIRWVMSWTAERMLSSREGLCTIKFFILRICAMLPTTCTRKLIVKLGKQILIVYSSMSNQINGFLLTAQALGSAKESLCLNTACSPFIYSDSAK